MMSRFLSIGAVAMLATGCLATTGDMRTITSMPDGALVQIDGYGECETPCSIKLDTIRQITVAKAGYLPQRFGIKPGRDDVHVILELAAPTDDVAVETLPDL